MKERVEKGLEECARLEEVFNTAVADYIIAKSDSIKIMDDAWRQLRNHAKYMRNLAIEYQKNPSVEITENED